MPPSLRLHLVDDRGDVEQVAVGPQWIRSSSLARVTSGGAPTSSAAAMRLAHFAARDHLDLDIAFAEPLQLGELHGLLDQQIVGDLVEVRLQPEDQLGVAGIGLRGC